MAFFKKPLTVAISLAVLGTSVSSLAEVTNATIPGAEQRSTESWDVLNTPGDKQTITIDTNQTTWSNLDVSPDGKQVVFDMLGDIYIMPITGGKATIVTNDVGWNIQPKFSPDGKKIAFISDRAGGDNLWVMDINGENKKQISKESHNIVHNPAWAPNGQYIAVKQGQVTGRTIPGGSIRMYHISGGQGVTVRDRLHGAKSQKNVAEPAFSTDGTKIYYSVDSTAGVRWEYNKNALGKVFEIRSWDLATGEEETVIRGSGGAIRPTPSPDGKSIAFVKRVDNGTAMASALYIKDLESGIEREVFAGLDRDLQEANGAHGNTPAFAYTPDGKSLIFWAGGVFRSVDIQTKLTKVIPTRVVAEKQMTPALRFAVDVAPDNFKVKMARWSQLSPDGKTALFQALGYLYIKDIASGKVNRLTSQTNHFEFYPSFSRDGKSIVYTTWDDNKLGTVRIISASGGNSKVLTKQPGHYISPSFSPNGQHILYKKVTGGYLLNGDWSMSPGIYLIDRDGKESRRVIKSGDNPHFGAAQDRIYFSAANETHRELKSVDLRGQQERSHFKGDYIFDFKVSPNGEYIAFIEHFNTFVAPFTSTGKTLSINKGTKSFPVKQVSKYSGDYLNWLSDSSALTWAFGPTLYQRKLTDTFAFLSGDNGDQTTLTADGIDLSFTHKADKPQGELALIGGTVVTMRDADKQQEMIENGVILIKENRIMAVGKQGEIDIPKTAKIVDIKGKTVIPGLIDAHAHGSYGSYDLQPKQNWNQYSNLSFGVTTIHDPSNNSSEVFSMAELAKAGLTVAPRIYSVGRILYAGHAPGYKTPISNLADAEFHVKRLKDAGAISVKSYNHPRRETRQQVLEAAKNMEIMVMPEGGSKFQHNMNMIVDGHTGVEHALPIPHIYSDIKQMWGQTDVGFTPTFVVAYGGIKGEDYFYEHTNVWENKRLMSFVPDYIVKPQSIRPGQAPERLYNHILTAQVAKQLRDEGVTVHIGAHGQREGLAAHWELWSMVQGGFSAWEALRSGTIDGAKYLGMDHDIGTIEKGKIADLAIIEGDVLNDIRQSEHVAYTVINGRIYDAESMNEIGNYDQKRTTFFFENGSKTQMHPATEAYMETKAHQYHWKH
ncbi:amidohydrolase family protein [Pseudoalteromonas aurantia]|uniref:Amidohydrolase n=1 Tax=Pseudoalteromonas aurantia TaxID=43654 RepID=A0A5S3V4F3_9GAMM|nr:amidohydrolase family protein [Pseudoalteromonas aurantia]TMO60814.1 amidohydrolase [Pseudoalteromonas aurantia]TMO65770.1 amidohydrolase [Pseudoalteromonas aurantia]TMO78288.1 amidohydrolase [Pseudoalteromonas aurantia]